jgi:putative transposase
VIARDTVTGEYRKIAVTDLRAAESSSPDAGLVSIHEPEDDDWAEARRRRALIEPFLIRRVSKEHAIEIAREAGVATRTLFRWAKRFRERRRLTVLLPFRPSGGRSKGRIPQAVEAVISEVIETFYKSGIAPTPAKTIERIKEHCRKLGLKPPGKNTVRNRLKAIPEREALRTRSNAKLSRARFDPKPGQYGEALAPLSVVQIDHTGMDVFVVDQESRCEIGRPIVTLLIDVFSRMVLGFFITLDRPSAMSVALSVVHSIFPKESWLRIRGIENEWPCWGFPAKLHSDNGKDLRANALRRACEQYGIAHDFRALLKPQMGGHIERLMGTVSREIHALPGTTKSNRQQRAEYRSADKAALTVPDLEYVVGEWITGVYHKRVHSGIGIPPLAKWEAGVFGDGALPGSGLPPRPIDDQGLLFDFLTPYERTIQDYGVVWDGVHYYDDVLRPYIGLRSEKGRKYLFKRDPRDISKIYFLDPATGRPAVIPFRNTTLPPMNVWELRRIRKELREAGRDLVDEEAIFQAYERMRQRIDDAVDLTKKARRQRESKRLHATQLKVRDTTDSQETAKHPVRSIPLALEKPEVLPQARRVKYADLEPFATEEL